MLVLSRRPSEKIVFPHLGITIEILLVKGNSVRVGIDAPATIKVFRHEVAAQLAKGDPMARLDPAVSNRLREAHLALDAVQRQLECGVPGDAQATLKTALGTLAALERDMARRSSPTPDRRTSRRALLVEDNPNEQRLLAEFLRLSGFRVDTASDGCDALDYLSHQRPDVVLLDMLMPRCSGPETVSAIRRDPALRDLTVFAVSGMSQEDVHIALGPHGINRWFSKPVDPQELIEAIDCITDAEAAR